MSQQTHPARIHLWLDRLNRQAASSLTVAEFCEREGVSLPSFYQWKRRLSPRVELASASQQSRQPSLGSSPVAQQPRFTELVLSAAPATACAALPSVSLPGGITITLGAQAEMAGLILDRLLQHVAQLHFNKAAAC